MKRKQLITSILVGCLVVSLCACGSSSEESAEAAADAESAEAETEVAEETGEEEEEVASEDTSTEKVSKDELVVGTTNDVTIAFDNFDSNNVNGEALCYDYLVYMDPDTNEFVSDVLEDWHWEGDTTLVMQIKPGVTFTNGDTLNGDDLIFSYQGRLESGVPQVEQLANFDWENAVVSDDGLTLTVDTFEEYAPGVAVLSQFTVESKRQHETYDIEDEIWWSTTCGTGPYKLVEQIDGVSATYELRDDYWDDSKEFMFDTVVIKHYGDETAEYTDFVNGNIDVALNLNEYSYQQLSNGEMEDAVVKLQTQGNYSCLSGNYEEDLWSDTNFRLAIAHSIDLDTLNITGFDGLGAVMDSIFPSNCIGYESVGIYEYDVDLAKEYLADSTYDGSTLKILARDRASSVAEGLQAMFTAIGVDSEVEALEFANYIDDMTSGNFDFIIIDMNTDNTGEPSNVYSNLGDADNLTPAYKVYDSGWNDKIPAANSVDEAERVEALAELQEYAYENAIVVPLMDRYEVWAYNNTVLPDDYNCYYGGYTKFVVEVK